MAMLGAALILTLARLVPPVSVATESKRQATISRRRSGFRILTVIGGFDTATRMGYLLFLPFLVQGRGGGLPTVGLALALLFIGGSFGKAVFGGLGERRGVRSEERRVGKECVIKCRSRGSPYH